MPLSAGKSPTGRRYVTSTGRHSLVSSASTRSGFGPKLSMEQVRIIFINAERAKEEKELDF